MGSGWGVNEGGEEGWVAKDFFEVLFSVGKSVNGAKVVPK